MDFCLFVITGVCVCVGGGGVWVFLALQFETSIVASNDIPAILNSVKCKIQTQKGSKERLFIITRTLQKCSHDGYYFSSLPPSVPRGISALYPSLGIQKGSRVPEHEIAVSWWCGPPLKCWQLTSTHQTASHRHYTVVLRPDLGDCCGPVHKTPRLCVCFSSSSSSFFVCLSVFVSLSLSLSLSLCLSFSLSVSVSVSLSAGETMCKLHYHMCNPPSVGATA